MRCQGDLCFCSALRTKRCEIHAHKCAIYSCIMCTIQMLTAITNIVDQFAVSNQLLRQIHRDRNAMLRRVDVTQESLRQSMKTNTQSIAWQRRPALDKEVGALLGCILFPILGLLWNYWLIIGCPLVYQCILSSQWSLQSTCPSSVITCHVQAVFLVEDYYSLIILV